MNMATLVLSKTIALLGFIEVAASWCTMKLNTSVTLKAWTQKKARHNSRYNLRCLGVVVMIILLGIVVGVVCSRGLMYDRFDSALILLLSIALFVMLVYGRCRTSFVLCKLPREIKEDPEAVKGLRIIKITSFLLLPVSFVVLLVQGYSLMNIKDLPSLVTSRANTVSLAEQSIVHCYDDLCARHRLYCS